MLFVNDVRRAKKAIGRGLIDYLDYARAKKDAVVCLEMLSDELVEEMLQPIIDQIKLKVKRPSEGMQAERAKRARPFEHS